MHMSQQKAVYQVQQQQPPQLRVRELDGFKYWWKGWKSEQKRSKTRLPLSLNTVPLMYVFMAPMHQTWTGIISPIRKQPRRGTRRFHMFINQIGFARTEPNSTFRCYIYLPISFWCVWIQTNCQLLLDRRTYISDYCLCLLTYFVPEMISGLGNT